MFLFLLVPPAAVVWWLLENVSRATQSSCVELSGGVPIPRRYHYFLEYRLIFAKEFFLPPFPNSCASCLASDEQSLLHANNGSLVTHVGDERTDHQIPKFKDLFVGGLAGDATIGNGVGFDNANPYLDTVSFEEIRKVIQGQSLLVGG